MGRTGTRVPGKWKTMREWCKENSINVNTFNSRLKVVREIALERCPELHEIVPVSISENIVTEKSSANMIPAAAVEPSVGISPSKPKK